MIGIVIVLILGIVGLFGVVIFNAVNGSDDATFRYSSYNNSGRGLAAWAYDMGYNASSGKDARLAANLKRNAARRTNKEVTVND